MRRAAVVIVRSGRSTRPATSQPSPIDATVMIASAIPDSVSSWFSSSAALLAQAALRLRSQPAVGRPAVGGGRRRAAGCLA